MTYLIACILSASQPNLVRYMPVSYAIASEAQQAESNSVLRGTCGEAFGKKADLAYIVK